MQSIILHFLKLLTQKIIRTHKPLVVGISGSVGKTSTREAVYLVVKQYFRARKPIENYNNEFGIPLTIIGGESASVKAVFHWLRIFIRGLWVWKFVKKYPQVLVLEYGIDGPGDMNRLTSIVRPDIALLTLIGNSHIEFFENQAALAHEKGDLFAAVADSGTVIVNADDQLVCEQSLRSKAKKIFYSLYPEQQFDVSPFTNAPVPVKLLKSEEILDHALQTSLTIQYGEETVTCTIPVAGKAHVQAVIAACAVGYALKIDSASCVKALAEYRSFPGRLNVLSGASGSTILDDSYNASPVSMRVGLDIASKMKQPKKIFVLGDMKELGEETAAAHQSLGEYAAQKNPDKLITIGELGQRLGQAALTAGYPETKYAHFADSQAAAGAIPELLDSNTLIYIKGSQFVRLERVTKACLADPATAAAVLVRQTGTWKGKV